MRFVVALVNATSFSSPSVSAVTVECLFLFGQVVQHQSDRDLFVTFEVCSQLVSLPLQSFLQLPHPIALALRFLIEFPELVVEAGPACVFYAVFSRDSGCTKRAQTESHPSVAF